MRHACHCGMTLERRHTLGCEECGTPVCSSCSLELDSTPYCRWCAASMAPAVSA